MPLWRGPPVIPGCPARQRTGTADEVGDLESKTLKGSKDFLPFVEEKKKINLTRSSSERIATQSSTGKRCGTKASQEKTSEPSSKPENKLIRRRSSSSIAAAPENPSSAVNIAGEQPNYT
jgi:hypothetical protein